MSLKDKFKNILNPIEDDENYLVFDNDKEVEALSSYESAKRPKVSVPSDAQMVLFEPRSFEESDEVATHLMHGQAAVVNLHRLQRDYAQRTIDFLTGVVFALNGSIKKIGHDVILCVPHSIGVEGDISMSIEDFED